MSTREISYSQAVLEALREEMKRDETVIILGETMRNSALLGEVRLPEDRVLEMPISEQGFMGMAFGAAMTGLRPIVDLMWLQFSAVCFDEIVNEIAKEVYLGGQKVPLVIRGVSGAGFGAGSHHSESVYAWFANVPGLKVILPSTPYDVKGLLKTAIRDDSPVICVEPLKLYSLKGQVPNEEYLIPFGVADIKREGKDVTIVATGSMVHRALEAASKLAKEGISVEVIDPRTIVPLDKNSIVESVKKTGRIVVVDEGPKSYGVSAEIAAVVAEEAYDSLKGPIRRVANPDTPVPCSPPIEAAVIPSEDRIIKAVKEVMSS